MCPQVVYTVEGESLVETQTGDGFVSRNVRDISGDEMTMVRGNFKLYPTKPTVKTETPGSRAEGWWGGGGSLSGFDKATNTGYL